MNTLSQAARRIRTEFPILDTVLPNGRKLVYLDTAASAQKPRCVIDCVSEVYSRHYANVHRGIHFLGDEVTTALERSRETIREFLNARSTEEIIFTSGTTAALNLVATGWGRPSLKAGDVVLLSPFEHHANIVPWQQAVRATGAELRYLPMTGDGRLEFDGTFPARTRVLSLSAMSNVLGTIPPFAEMIRAARGSEIVTVLDAAQYVPHGKLDVQSLGVDFLAFSGHKLYGPSGIGVLYGRREQLLRTEPILFGGNMISEVGRERSSWADPPARFEAGTLPIAEAIGLGSAIEFLGQVGWEQIELHERTLTTQAYARLTQVEGLRLYGPGPESRGAIFSFTLDGVHAHDVAEILNTHGVAIRAGHHCTMPLHDLLGVPATARASFALYNEIEEIEILIEAIQDAQRIFNRKSSIIS